MTRGVVRYEAEGRTSPQFWNVERVIAELRAKLQSLDRTITDLERMAQRIDLVLAAPAARSRNTGPVSSRTRKPLVLVAVKSIR